MAKSKEGKDTEFYRGKIRELESVNKSLKRRLKQLEKHQHQYEDNQEEYTNKVLETIVKLRQCPNCHESSLEEIEVANRKFDKCSSCEYRSPVKK